MKKILILSLVAVLILAGCGSSNELESFAESFNKRAVSEDVPELIPEEFSEMQEDEGEYWRELYESEKYSIDAYYEDGKKLSMYALNISAEEPFDAKEGEGYRAGIMTARALGLSTSDYVKNFEKALQTDRHEYTENGYEIKFIYIGWDSSTLRSPIYVHFEKK